ncbi:DUF3564 domain-containing protein [Paraburkholderia sp. CNPSo 3272]|uniref:DUF3564 family protein n=1 Tax=Paraburkholderia sp. CNPSo 3272 TaxID=2940931 RepID=UPI0020B689D3|nr:DUF3564 family protein [Paraburkholderia sp. CNPSo 3272]MCP3727522.1 DUF3564 domain-containing protein [Paraburkholderia sp. CNPSo 3272]
MRLTILINGPDPSINHDFALVWLDTEEHRWSRESHEGVELPSWGEIRESGGQTALCAPGGDTPLCTIQGLCLTPRQQIGAAQGQATWSSSRSPTPVSGYWRLQAVDRGPVRAADALFAGHHDPRARRH